MLLRLFFTVLSCMSFFFCTSQEIVSYALTRSYSPQTGGSLPCSINNSLYLVFEDNTVTHPLYGTLYATQSNYDGSTVYSPLYSENGALYLQGLVVSQDHRQIREISASSMMGMTLQMISEYSYIGDGKEPALNYSGASARAFISGNPDPGYQNITCHSCGGSGVCKYCGGSGKDQYTSNGRCGVCNGRGRCAGCDGKGSY